MPIGTRSRSTGRIFTGADLLEPDSLVRFLTRLRRYTAKQAPPGRRAGRLSFERFVFQIQFWKIISRVNVAIDVSTDATVIGSIAAKPTPASPTNAHNSQRGVLPRLNA